VAIAGQIQLVLADMLRGEPIGRGHEVPREVADTAQVAVAGIGAVPTDAGLFIHPVAESPHDALLLAVTGVGRTADGRSVWLEVRSGTEKDGTKAGALPRRTLMTLFSSQSIGC
jgi:hypothetical protein